MAFGELCLGNIAQQIQTLEAQITTTAHACGRTPKDIQLLAVSKGQSVTAMREAYAMLLTHFGESYVQEAREKMQLLSDLSIVWHFIGTIQRNKTKFIAENFSWVHSISRLDIAQRLHEARPENLCPLNVCIQVNLDKDAGKSGALPTEVISLAKNMIPLTKVHLRGLMAIPNPRLNPVEQYDYFSRLKQLQTTISDTLNYPLDTLSMGMSHDWPAAIRAGSTLLRLGQGIFGKRHNKNPGRYALDHTCPRHQ